MVVPMRFQLAGSMSMVVGLQLVVFVLVFMPMLAGGVPMGMSVLVGVGVGVAMGMLVAVNHIAMTMLVPVPVDVLVIVMMLVLVPPLHGHASFP